eukprot:g5106.t1
MISCDYLCLPPSPPVFLNSGAKEASTMSTTAATTAQADQTERRPDPSPTSSPLRKKARLPSPPTASRPVLAE